MKAASKEYLRATYFGVPALLTIVYAIYRDGVEIAAGQFAIGFFVVLGLVLPMVLWQIRGCATTGLKAPTAYQVRAPRISDEGTLGLAVLAICLLAWLGGMFLDESVGPSSAGLASAFAAALVVKGKRLTSLEKRHGLTLLRLAVEPTASLVTPDGKRFVYYIGLS